MNLKPLKTKKDYERALERLEMVFDAPANSAERDEAEILSMLISNYENEHYPMDALSSHQRKNWAKRFKKMSENKDDELLIDDVLDDELLL